MKKISLLLICIFAIALLTLPVAAEDGIHDQSSLDASAAVDPLDQDADGIPDYMDNLVDLDGDGLHDIEPTYQEPSSDGYQPPIIWNNKITVIAVFAFVAVVSATVYLKIKSKKDKK